MLIHQLPLDAAFAALRSVPSGLSRADAALRRLEFGPNRIERLPGTPPIVRFVSQFTHFFAVLLWLAALLALIADRWMPGQGMATLAIAIVAVIVINGASRSGRSTGPKKRWPRCSVCSPSCEGTA
jgi:sodium/potassium-transporting ATPase subunit alpha